jgi:2'-hydroxyisoflavone reductase
MKLLVLGGTQFVGRHIVELALSQGHEVTLFNRGKTQPGLHAGVKQLIGDRKSDVSALQKGEWDVVIDACGYTQRDVINTTQALAQRVKHYVFISSISVYASFREPNDESSTTGVIEDSDTEIVDGRTYGPLKAACEVIVQAQFAERATLIRPGLVVGPHDHTDRFTYWVARMNRSGEILAPNHPQDPVQFIDARDLAAFTLHCAQQRLAGVFNVVAPTLGIGQLLQYCQEVTAVSEGITWVKAQYLARHNIQAWQDLPLWMSPQGDDRAVALTRNDKAIAAGLSTRAVSETIADTLRWHLARPLAEQQILKAGLSAEREAALLSGYQMTQGK